MCIKGKVSVIVPVYNSEKTIERCVLSIVAQKYTELEIILVNDGSTDNSAVVCERLSCSDERIIFINKKNEGVSSARNAGIDMASGEYCCFVDSDDWIDDSHIYKLVEAMSNTEGVVEGYVKEFNNSSTECGLKRDIYDFNNIKFASILDFFKNGYIHPCWNKLFILSIIKDKKIRFKKEINISEDTIFCLEYMMYCKTLNAIDATTYHYRLNESQISLSKKVYADIFDTYGKVFYALKGLLKKTNLTAKESESILVQTIYPQVYASILKIIQDADKSFKDKKKILNSLWKYEYCCVVLDQGEKYISSTAERLILKMIKLRRYIWVWFLLKIKNR